MAQERSEITTAIEKDHEELRHAMNAIAEYARSHFTLDGFRERKMELLLRLRDFQNHLLKHFDLEEEGGFMEDIVKIAPHSANEVERLEREHEKFLSDLRQILNDVKRASNPESSSFVAARRHLEELFSLMDDHEARERELLQVSYLQDLGTGD